MTQLSKISLGYDLVTDLTKASPRDLFREWDTAGLLRDLEYEIKESNVDAISDDISERWGNRRQAIIDELTQRGYSTAIGMYARNPLRSDEDFRMIGCLLERLVEEGREGTFTETEFNNIMGLIELIAASVRAMIGISGQCPHCRSAQAAPHWQCCGAPAFPKDIESKPSPVLAAIAAHRKADAAHAEACKGEPEQRGPTYEAWWEAAGVAGSAASRAGAAIFDTKAETVGDVIAALEHCRDLEENHLLVDAVRDRMLPWAVENLSRFA